VRFTNNVIFVLKVTHGSMNFGCRCWGASSWLQTNYSTVSMFSLVRAIQFLPSLPYILSGNPLRLRQSSAAVGPLLNATIACQAT